MADQRKPLTELQAKVLAYLVKCVELEDRIPPNRVIANDFGWSSPTAANEHLQAIERKGWLTRTHYGALMLADRPRPSVVYIDPEKVTESDLAALKEYAQQTGRPVLVVADTTIKPNGGARHG